MHNCLDATFYASIADTAHPIDKHLVSTGGSGIGGDAGIPFGNITAGLVLEAEAAEFRIVIQVGSPIIGRSDGKILRIWLTTSLAYMISQPPYSS